MGEFKTKTIIFFTLSVIFALAAAYLFLSHVRETEQAMGELVPVAIAREDIPANGLITLEKLETTGIPRKYVSPSMYTDLQQLANQVALVPIKKQDMIIRAMVRAKDQLPTDSRVVYLREPVAVFDGNFTVGDRVDLLVTNDQENEKTTSILLSNVEVADLIKGKEERLNAMGVTLKLESSLGVVQALNRAKEVRVLRRPLGNQ